ncbi:MAG: TatD family hydrolase [Spirochaetaceae bacterium]|jgi:TatD DNase family protein|nr:TatD family hydrolase [Spirochaetaceae bacterium]
MNNQLKGFTDAHAHLAMLFDIDREAGQEARLPDDLALCGGAFLLDIGTQPDDLGPRIAQFGRFPNVRFAGGVWPHKEAVAAPQESARLLEAALARAAPSGLLAAVGECGYDRRENPTAPEGETTLLELQLSLAGRYKLPIVIHSREAPRATIETLARFPDVRAVIHCFSYGVEEAKKFLELGCHISFAGNLTYKNAHNLREAIQIVPAGRLLLETDSPFLSPVPFRGKTCRPPMIAETYKTAAALRNTGVEELKQTIARNAEALFLQ